MNMRVLHVVATDRRRGAEVFAADLVGALADSGVSQRVAVVRGSTQKAVEYGALVEHLGSTSSRHIPGLRLQPRAVRRLSGLVSDWVPHVVQVHGGEPLKYALHSTNGNAPIVYRRIGSAVRKISHGPRRVLQTRRMRRAGRVVTVAEVLRREAIDMFRVPGDRVVTIPNGVDPRRLEPARTRAETRRGLGIPPAALVLLSLGALTWEKDPLTHLDIARRVLRVRPDTVHLIVGEGPLRSDVEVGIQRLGLRNRSLVLGPRNDVPDLMAATDLLLLASRTEGAPGCLIEAGMAGVPAAAYAVGGVPEVVEDGATGRLAPPGDVDALADRVIELLGNPAERERMGSAARERSHVFDIRTIAPMYLALYEELF